MRFRLVWAYFSVTDPAVGISCLGTDDDLQTNDKMSVDLGEMGIHRYDSIKWNIFLVTGPLCGEFTNYRWIPLTKASDAELWYFLSSVPKQTVE